MQTTTPTPKNTPAEGGQPQPPAVERDWSPDSGPSAGSAVKTAAAAPDSHRLGFLTVGRRISVGLILVFACLASIIAFLIYSSGQIIIGSRLYGEIIRAKDLTADVIPPPANIIESYLIVHEMGDERDPAKLRAMQEHAAKLRKQYHERHDYWISQLPKGAIRDAMMGEVHTSAEAFFRIEEKELYPALLANNFEKADEIMTTRLKAEYDKHRVAIDRVVELANEQAASTEAFAASVVRNKHRLGLIFTLSVGLVAAGIGFALVRSINRPIHRMIAELNQIEKGDTRVRLTASGRDELGRVARSLNSALDNLAEQSRAIQEQARERERTLTTVAQNAQTLGAASEQLAANSQQMVSNAQEAASQAGVVSAAAEQVSRNVQTVATGTEEMTASIREIAKNAQEAAKVATSAVHVAESANATVTKLGESSCEIGKVIKVITSIAQQTNLLALNATIEAARAGEAGKGFAVVANEVKELAKETAKATEDISRKIEAIQGDTKSAVEAISEIGGIISKISDYQNTIASAVEEQTATTNEISRNVAEAARGSADIAQNINRVALVAKSTTAGANDTQGASTELSRMAATLLDLANHGQRAA